MISQTGISWIEKRFNIFYNRLKNKSNEKRENTKEKREKILKKINPEVILVPLLAFDKYKNRIGYGRGYYDKFLNTYLKKHKKLLTVGIAFSFQKYHNLPVDKKDFKLDHVLTEKGVILWKF